MLYFRPEVYYQLLMLREIDFLAGTNYTFFINYINLHNNLLFTCPVA